MTTATVASARRFELLDYHTRTVRAVLHGTDAADATTRYLAGFGIEAMDWRFEEHPYSTELAVVDLVEDDDRTFVGKARCTTARPIVLHTTLRPERAELLRSLLEGPDAVLPEWNAVVGDHRIDWEPLEDMDSDVRESPSYDVIVDAIGFRVGHFRGRPGQMLHAAVAAELRRWLAPREDE